MARSDGFRQNRDGFNPQTVDNRPVRTFGAADALIQSFPIETIGRLGTKSAAPQPSQNCQRIEIIFHSASRVTIGRILGKLLG
jgi:hypothetical protein